MKKYFFNQLALYLFLTLNNYVITNYEKYYIRFLRPTILPKALYLTVGVDFKNFVNNLTPKKIVLTILIFDKWKSFKVNLFEMAFQYTHPKL